VVKLLGDLEDWFVGGLSSGQAAGLFWRMWIIVVKPLILPFMEVRPGLVLGVGVGGMEDSFWVWLEVGSGFKGKLFLVHCVLVLEGK